MFDRDELLELLDVLGVNRGDLVYLQSSTSFLGATPRDALSIIELLLERLGSEGTLLMPSFGWMPVRGATGEVLGNPSGIFDVRRSPSMVGLISELFRRLPGTTRSEQYWLPVCGQGRLAEELLTDQARVVHPFGPGSTFDRMRGRGGKHLGLGVTLNTSTLSHLADFDLESHGIRTFWPKPLEGQIRNHSGETVHVATIVVKPEVRASYRPTRLFEASKLLDESVRRRDAGCAVRVSYSLDLYHSEAVRIGRERLQLGLLPPWLEEIEPVHLR